MVPLQAISPFFRGRIPGQLIIQFSNHCNADCPQCGMRRSNAIPRRALSKESVKRLIDQGAEKGVQALSLTGGEPLLHLKDLVELINYAKEAGIPCVRTGSNGYFFSRPDSPDFEKRITAIAEDLSRAGIYSFWISLDSANPDDHEAMRGLNGVVEGIKKGLPIFHSHNIYPSANLGINRNTGGNNPRLYENDLSDEEFLAIFKNNFRKFYQFVIDLGFTTASACYPMSDEGEKEQKKSTYGAISTDQVIHFTPREKGLLFEALYTTIPEFRSKLRIFTPLCSLYNLMRQYREGKNSLYTCHGGKDFFFVECGQGKIHPCGYLDATFDDIPDLRRRADTKKECNLCEWECFRDPSDLMGPFAELFSSPLKLAGKMINNPKYYSILRKDLKYYKACNYFDGTIPPDYPALLSFN